MNEYVNLACDNLDEEHLEGINKIENVDSVSYDGNILLITYKKGDNNLPHLIDYLKDEGIKYNKIYSERPTLNDVFLELTGKELRD